LNTLSRVLRRELWISLGLASFLVVY
jgi:hypothetical protein